MYLRQVLIFAVVICCSLTGCRLYSQKTLYPEPPATTYRVTHFTVTVAGDLERVQAAAVTPDFFKIAKALPLIGRTFVAGDYQGKAQDVLLSNRFWQRKFAGNPNVIGDRIEVDRKTLTIIGVMPESFDLPPGTELWIPQETPAP